MEGMRLRSAAALLLVLCILCIPVCAAEEQGVRLIPSGETVGIHVDASGLLVVGISEVETEAGMRSPAREAGMCIGDFILAVGPREVTTIQELRDALAASAGGVAVRFLRDGREMQLTVTPALGERGEKELGLWLRSGISGLGTLTYIVPGEGGFGALGHGVSDGDTGLLVPLKTGRLGYGKVDTIQRGEKGKPGEAKGSLGLDAPIGVVTRNTACGIFGRFSEAPAPDDARAIDICTLSALHCGPAAILSDISGEVRGYAVEISRIYPEGGGRDMLLTITDAELLALTGGIVQGMSGCPILQNGCLAGAVTHVLVNDPARGYGISIERMLEAAA